MVAVTEFQKIGIGLVGFGLFFLLFGVLLYFDSVLLAFGNILFLTGLTFIIGFRKTSHFFFQRHKFRGSFFFLGGVSLVLCRWPVIGMLLEGYGSILLFRVAPAWSKSTFQQTGQYNKCDRQLSKDWRRYYQPLVKSQHIKTF
ncbi:vesicle transport protein GOT1A isoform X2 [Phyllopteryx taeniolatus]|uniref:vesicle transport protein GOT1A isoform X2 n=1 Tax=Phyllopteryx taeniolatus TaxID=161469 RepID=UPI002AD42088|nr:vesicle transport protein GOT1A isoform X2 [Phyllopteryx taeniolatus]